MADYTFETGISAPETGIVDTEMGIVDTEMGIVDPETGISAPVTHNEEMGEIIRTILSPVLEAMTTFMQKSTEALDRVAAQQKIQSDRMEQLEKQIRLNTPVTPTQVRYLNDAVRKQARSILSAKSLEDDKQAVNKLSAAIRKSIVARYGIAALHEIPKHEYGVAMQQIETWNDMLTIRDVVREARNRLEEME